MKLEWLFARTHAPTEREQDTASSLRIFAPIDAVMQLLSVELQLDPEMEMPRPHTELPHVYGTSEGATLASLHIIDVFQV